MDELQNKIDVEDKNQPPNQDPKPMDPPKAEPSRLDIQEVIMGLDANTVRKIPAVQKLLEAVRSEEKDKLYKSMEGKDNTIKEQKETISDLQKQLEEKGNVSMENEKELLAQLQAMKEAQDDLMKKLDAKDEEARMAKVQTHKEKAIASANGELIESLVSGNTIEEVDASIELAKAEYQKIASKFQAQSKVQEEEAQKAKEEAEKAKQDVEKEKAKANVPPTTNPSVSNSLNITAEDIKKMSPAEYAKYREELLRGALNKN